MPSSSTPFFGLTANLGQMHQLSAAVTPGPGTVPYIGLAVFAVALALIWILFTTWRRRQVHGASAALKYLVDLNSRYRAAVAQLPPIRFSFATAVNSKSKLDRFDLPAFVSLSILERESAVEGEVRLRLTTIERYVEYRNEWEWVGRTWLGKGNHPRVNPKRFVSIEDRLFRRHTLKAPTAKARVSATVKHTSPKGKNHYSRRLDWNFIQLRDGLRGAQAQRELQSTAEFQRERERSLMTPNLRMTIMRRDGYRCRMCGCHGRIRCRPAHRPHHTSEPRWAHQRTEPADALRTVQPRKEQQVCRIERTRIELTRSYHRVVRSRASRFNVRDRLSRLPGGLQA
jgi:hypothetical protein